MSIKTFIQDEILAPRLQKKQVLALDDRSFAIVICVWKSPLLFLNRCFVFSTP